MTASPSIRVRIAPSPTGNLHVGTARTALFNFLFARHTGGTFVLRIEDTDVDRSQAEYTQNIFDSLHALGLSWDEGPDVGGPYGPYRQMERLDRYQAVAERLRSSGQAYPCYCTQAELDAERDLAMAEKRPYIYSRRCLNPETAAELAKDPERKPTLRLRIPDGRGDIVFQDAIRGEIRFDATLLGDFVLMKSNGTPSYNFAVVVDDIDMRISHVVRGEDHVPNTPRQMLLFEALGEPLPVFAHVGMILAPDRSKLSKRHGATAVSEFIKQGYLPEAFCNFLALLGWSPPDGQEVGSVAHFAEQFTLERITQSPAVFDPEKLNWLNGLYLRQMPLDELLMRARPYLAEFPLTRYNDEQLMYLLSIVREPLTTLGELPDAVRLFFTDTVACEPGIQEDVLNTADSQQVLRTALNDWLPTLDLSSPETIAASLKALTQQLKPLKPKTVMWALRAALTGATHGPDLSGTFWLLGADTVRQRLRAALVESPVA